MGRLWKHVGQRVKSLATLLGGILEDSANFWNRQYFDYFIHTAMSWQFTAEEQCTMRYSYVHHPRHGHPGGSRIGREIYPIDELPMSGPGNKRRPSTIGINSNTRKALLRPSNLNRSPSVLVLSKYSKRSHQKKKGLEEVVFLIQRCF